MIGHTVIGGMIIPLAGNRPHVERGWIKRCPTKTDWNVQPRNNVATNECVFRGISDMEIRNGN